jgi:hypothetical protein
VDKKDRALPAGLSAAACLVALAVGVSCMPPADARGPRGALVAAAIDVPLGRDDEAPRVAPDAAVVLVTLDGVRWQDVFVGADPGVARAAGVRAPTAAVLMPHLHALVAQRGVALGAPGHGPPVSASGPSHVSLPGYTEIFTGRRSHECADNACGRTRIPTVFDEARDNGGDGADVAVFASWERMDRAATARPGRFVLSCGRTRAAGDEVIRADDTMRDLLDRAARSDPYPGSGDYRPDRLTAALALRYLETRRPTLLFVGLGEPDEYAHRGDYAGYLASLRAADDTLGELFEVLGRMGPRGEHTSVIVTADHGRGRDWRSHGRDYPESGRVWLVAAGPGVTERGLATSVRPHALADVAPTVRVLLGLPPDEDASAGSPLAEVLEGWAREPVR